MDEIISLEKFIPESYGDAIKNRCFVLFCQGLSAAQIEESVGPPERVIRKWIRQEDWEAERETARIKAREVLANDAIVDIATTQARHLKLSRALQRVVEREIEKVEDEEVARNFNSWKEIAEVAKTAAQMEKDAVIGNIEQDFLLKVVNIIKEEVSDPEARKRIAEKLRQLVS